MTEKQQNTYSIKETETFLQSLKQEEEQLTAFLWIIQNNPFLISAINTICPSEKKQALCKHIQERIVFLKQEEHKTEKQII